MLLKRCFHLFSVQEPVMIVTLKKKCVCVRARACACMCTQECSVHGGQKRTWDPRAGVTGSGEQPEAGTELHSSELAAST